MKEVNMHISWRTVQMFLEDTGVAEVEVDQKNKSKIRCSCPAFFKSARCKHVKYVREQMSTNHGHYSIQIPLDVDETEAIAAIDNPEEFRNFVIKYGKVEVID
jgi:hypothetical protein